MLGLKLPTDPRWVEIVETNIPEILTDHAYCEQKATTNAMYIVINFPEYTELVSDMIDLAQEELQHFKMVHDIIKKRGLVLGRERKDPYAGDIYAFMRKGHIRKYVLIDRLLFSALIEARSCERFRLLSEQISDPELKEFYRELMISEATHYTTFINYARKYSEGEDIDKRWQEFLAYEATVISKYGDNATMHG
ncbi:tRNA-(ms[2]io[6]A)-hydroxylase [Cytophaga hutchinsonii]|uniref:Hydroxylase for synthesis of 2-methylthio-cis-ribozeatin in tRNA n=1 Tax=Cytophaga hutchinsonii (strain ATCC 33406 / DSM 1761 / CIP 103989 / NBRC 15051 / NCIMB 9469 / D465) TaxID=269798 RepID=A0A6N4SNQ2_CYTH3|nr:tRNA-(ms[2]io[6]A)-hydroxylase [Cytophaga hutchinsonii]ABG57914.1 hydroxylase for synthesis of 2-methylthio-cis-ribozeatin in tRNA [Cytophaga hutchinsonii ATCC 33406]SFX08915.1 tRNA-(ms[2]io[6]A)-hydroxylase [Cytophaga hutchinsonii ATCC 33406]